MYEYVSRAVVLEKKTAGEHDARVALFSEKFGKVEARAKSARKITSKLSAHLEPGVLSIVRIVENRGVHIADALKTSTTLLSLRDLGAINRLLVSHQQDRALWGLLTGTFTWRKALAILGWEPRHASCAACGQSPVAVFYVGGQEFYCASCALSLSAHPYNANGRGGLAVAENELLYI